TVSGDDPFVAGGLEVRRDANRPNGWIVAGELASVLRKDEKLLVWWRGRQYEYERGVGARVAEVSATHLEAPMPGQVIAVRVAEGETVVRGQELVVVEAMKMEHSIAAPADGVVEAVFCKQGDQVERGKVLVDFEPS
ncbi:MAG TPA: biotin/lipoyl-containing protein, partial [Actinomycetota bacterium]|nr:biotin/lipoyl-containing protein [Actinomycetota bacterium]